MDIVERLREKRGILDNRWPGPTELELEAAAEIERLRAPMGKPIEQAPRDGEEQAFAVKFNTRAFWDVESKRWILSYPLQTEYLPSHSRYLGPVHLPRADTGGGE
jgi:hypothetical protein